MKNVVQNPFIKHPCVDVINSNIHISFLSGEEIELTDNVLGILERFSLWKLFCKTY